MVGIWEIGGWKDPAGRMEGKGKNRNLKIRMKFVELEDVKTAEWDNGKQEWFKGEKKKGWKSFTF